MQMSQSAARPITTEPFNGQRPSSTPFLENVRNAIRSVNPFPTGLSSCKIDARGRTFVRWIVGEPAGGRRLCHPYRTTSPSANKIYDLRVCRIGRHLGLQLGPAIAMSYVSADVRPIL